MKYRDYRFLGATQSLCPHCLKLVVAKIICRGKQVFFRKNCPDHGVREDFVCSDVDWFDRNDFSLPGKVPLTFGTEERSGCPYDCGLCSEHEQHTCIGLLEITSSCNLECPICFANSGPRGNHLSFEQCKSAIDALVAAEGQPEVLQLSGGEPTVHPGFSEIFDYACKQPIDVVMINTNGIRIAQDPALVDELAAVRNRAEVYLQFDSFEDPQTDQLRGQSLVEIKLKAIEKLGIAGVRTTLVCTLQRGVNENQIGRLMAFALERPWITGVSFQPTTYSGRFFLPEETQQRITFPEVLASIAEQTNGRWRTTDFSPLPCAHPNAHTLGYAFRSFDEPGPPKLLPLARFINLDQHLELLAGRITFDRNRTKELVQTFLKNASGCAFSSLAIFENQSGDCSRSDDPFSILDSLAPEDVDQFATGLEAIVAIGGVENVEMTIKFLRKALTKQLAPEDMLRVTTTSFMDAYNFDIRQLMKSCVHHVLPTGHIIPFSAYNVLYRDGHVALPSLNKSLVSLQPAP